LYVHCLSSLAAALFTVSLIAHRPVTCGVSHQYCSFRLSQLYFLTNTDNSKSLFCCHISLATNYSTQQILYYIRLLKAADIRAIGISDVSLCSSGEVSERPAAWSWRYRLLIGATS
jgi:hypothetical protein